MRSIRSRLAVLLLALSLLLPLTGCGKLELNQLAMVMAVGLDKTPSGAVKITAQIVRTTSTKGGSAGGGSSGGGEPVWIVSAEGPSILEAIRNLARFTSRRVFWAHNRVIVVGEEYAKADIQDMIDFFTRNHELRMNTWVIAVKGPASKLVASDTGLETIPGDSIDRLFRFNRIVSEAPRTTIREVMAAYLHPTSNPVIALVSQQKHEYSMKKQTDQPQEKQTELSGAAVFRKNKMLGTLTPSESRGLLFFIEKVESSAITVPCPNDGDKTASLELTGHHFSVTPSFSDGRVTFRIRLTGQMSLMELGCPAPDGVEATARQLERLASDKFQKDLEGVLHKAIDVYKTDFLDLGKIFHNKYPEYWGQVGSEWPKYFAEADTHVEVSFSINNPVLMILPTRRLTVPKEGGDGL